VRTHHRYRILGHLTLALATLAAPAAACAQDYPVKPIRWIIPYPPGGTSDYLARIIGQKITEAWKQNVIIDNRTGANGNIGTEAAVRAPADGYTMLLVATTFTMNAGLYTNLPFDSEKDLAPVTNLLYQSYVLCAHPSLPVSTVQQLVALAKAKPGAIDYGSGGQVNAGHISAELFSRMAGVKMNHVPYRGIGLAIPALLAGEVQILFSPLVAIQPHLKSGRMRAVAATSLKRIPALPDLPTVSESGVPGFQEGNWQGLLVPTGTPRGIVMKLNQEFVRILKNTDVGDQIVKIGAEVIASTPEQLGTTIRADLRKYTELIKSLGIRVE